MCAMNMKIENGYQVIAIAKVLDRWVGENSFSNCVCEIINNGWIDLNESEDTWFDLDYFNEELEEWLNNLESHDLNRCVCEIVCVLKAETDLQWRRVRALDWIAYVYCFNADLNLALMRKFSCDEEFSKKAVEIVGVEFKEMKLDNYENLLEHFRNEIANSENVEEVLYHYNMCALVFSFINDLKGGEKDD